MVFDPPVKSKRRTVGRYLWLLLLAVAVVIAVVVTAAGTQTRTELDYLENIGSQTDELARSGASLADVMTRLRTIDRDEFTAAMDGAATNLEAAVSFVVSEPPTESLIPVWALYRQTIETWIDGVNTLRDSILKAADEPNNSAVFNQVGDALADLRAGDNLYADLKAELGREEIPSPVSPFVDVRLTPNEAGVFSLSQSYIAAARSSTNSLGLRPDLKISQIVGDPAWEINVDDQPVVPFTESMVFSVVVTNAGNVESVPGTVEMTLIRDGEPIVAQAEVPALRPDGQTTVELDPVDVVPDTLYEVTMKLITSGIDADPTNNEATVQFTINKP